MHSSLKLSLWLGQAEIDARAKELDEVAKRVKAKQEAELAEKVAKAKEKAKGV